MPIRKIARRTDLSRNTIWKYLREGTALASINSKISKVIDRSLETTSDAAAKA